MSRYLTFLSLSLSKNHKARCQNKTFPLIVKLFPTQTFWDSGTSKHVFCSLLRFYQAINVTLSTNPVSNLEPTDKSCFYKTDENNYRYVPTKKTKALSAVSVKFIFCLWMKYETLSTLCLACDQNLPTISCKLYQIMVMLKIPEISVRIQMERSILVSSDWNIRDHLWRWSTYFGWNILTDSLFHFWQTSSLPLLGNSEKEWKMIRAIPIGWSGLIGKRCSIFVGYSHWSLTSWFGIMASTLSLIWLQ